MDSTNNPFLITLRIPIQPSILLYRFVHLIHFLALFMPWLTGLSVWIKSAITIYLIVSYIYFINKWNGDSEFNDVREIILNQENEWQLVMKNGQDYRAVLGKSCFVHPQLTIISLKFNNLRRYFYFTKENIGAEQFRYLRIRLRFDSG